MRNLKRALSLALASIMVFSMMVVGAGAVNLSDFSDKDKIANEEAVTVLTTLGVINGKDDGSYDPEGIVTRAEMAKMICIILNGGNDPQLGADVQSTYTDTVGHWAAGYIEYCTTLGIVSGRGNGTFDPNGTVTVAEAGKMVLVALGYNPSVEGYTGAQWQIKTDVRANQLKLYAGLGTLNTDVDLTRDNAAQMLYNALDVHMVEYSYAINGTADNAVTVKPQLNDGKKGTLLYEKFGAVKVQGVVYGNEFANVKANKEDLDKAPKGVNIGTAQDTGKTLLLVTNYNSDLTFSKNDEQNVFSNKETTFSVATGENEIGKSVWMYVKPGSTSLKSEVIGSVIISDENNIVEDASGDTTKEVADDNNLNLTGDTRYIYNYAGMTTTAPAKDGWKGVQKTLIDTDGDNDVDYVLYREMRLGKITLLTESGDGQIVVNVTGDYTTTKGSYINKDKDDIMGFENVAQDDIVLAAYFGGKLHVQKAETVTGKIEAYKQTNDKTLTDGYRNTAFTVDTENYDVSRVDSYTGSDMTAAIQSVDKTILSSEATFYLDENGYVIAYGDVDETAYKYAYVWGAEAGGNITTDRVKATLEDGTTKTFDLSTNSDVDVVKDSGTTTADGKTAKTTSIRESEMKGMVFSYTLTSGGDIKLYRSKTGTVKAPVAPNFTKGLTNIRVSGVDTVDYMTPYALSGSVKENQVYYSNNSTTFFYVTYKAGTQEIDKVSVYNGRNNAPSVDGTGNANVSTVLALNAKGDVGSAVFTDVKVSESAGDHMFVYANGFVSEDFALVDAFMNGAVVATKDVKAALYVDNEVVHNPDITDGIYLYSQNSDGYYELTRPSDETYFISGVVARVNKANNTFVITNDGTINGTFQNECRITKDSIVVDNTLDTVVAVSGGNVTEGDRVEVIVNNADDSQVLMAAIMKHGDSTNGSTGPELTWDGKTQPSGSKQIWVMNETGKLDETAIMEAFQQGYDVYVDDDFTTIDNGLTVPKGRTLYVTGNVSDTLGNVSGLGSVKVGGNLTTASTGINNTLEVHKNWILNANTTIANGVTVTVAGTVSGSVDLTVGNSVVTNSAKLYAGKINLTGDLTINGHVEVNGNKIDSSAPNADVTADDVIVNSSSTLSVNGLVTCATLTVGNASNAGKATMGSLDASGTVTLVNGSASTTGNFTANALSLPASAGKSVSLTVTGDAEVATPVTMVANDTTLSIGGELTADVTVKGGNLKADELTGNLTVEGAPTVNVPTVDGKVDTSGVTGGSVTAGNSADSAVILENVTIKKNTIYNGNVTIVGSVKIDKDVTVTFNGTVTDLSNLLGVDNTARVVFGPKASVSGIYGKFLDNKGVAVTARNFANSTFVFDGTNFVVKSGTAYVVSNTIDALQDSANLYV